MSEAVVDLDAGTAVAKLADAVDDTVLVNAVVEAGYEVKGVSRRIVSEFAKSRRRHRIGPLASRCDGGADSRPGQLPATICRKTAMNRSLSDLVRTLTQK